MLHDESNIVGEIRLRNRKVGIIPFAFFSEKSDKSAMEKNQLRQRVDARLAQLELGAVEAAAKVPELERNYIRDLLEGKKQSFSGSKLELVARALRWTVPELMGQAASAPLLDQVSAGELLAPLSQIDASEAKKIFFADLGPGEFIALTVRGDSMNKISPDGSVILINKSDQQLVSGKPYVFELDGDVTYKTWKVDPQRFEPQSTNKKHKPTPLKKRDFRIVGRVRRTMTDL